MVIDPITGEFLLDDNGHEIPDPTPVALPSGFKRPETLAEQVQRLVRSSISRHAEAQGHETWEEANDFEVDDDFDPSTPYEEFFDPVLGKNVTPDEFRRHADRYREEVVSRTKNYWRLKEQEQALEGHDRGAGVSPAPSSSPPQAAPAEPQKGR